MDETVKDADWWVAFGVVIGSFTIALLVTVFCSYYGFVKLRRGKDVPITRRVVYFLVVLWIAGVSVGIRVCQEL